MNEKNKNVLEMRNITKVFGAVTALKDMSFRGSGRGYSRNMRRKWSRQIDSDESTAWLLSL